MVSMEKQGKTLVVSPQGELDHYSAERMRAQVDAAFEKSPCIHMVMDFGQVSFMDSSGIGMIIGRYKHAEKRGGRMGLSNMNDEMAKLFTLSGLAKIITRYTTTEEALQSLNGGDAQ